MGLDATTKRHDGAALGTFAEVQETLSSVFPGLVLRRSLSGTEKLQNLSAGGLAVPAAIREHLLAEPPVYEGAYQGARFSVEFCVPVSESILDINVAIRGTASASEPLFALLEQRFGWITTPSVT